MPATGPIGGTPLLPYLDGLRRLANSFPSFAMVMFDSKLDDATAGAELHTAVQRYLGSTWCRSASPTTEAVAAPTGISQRYA